MPAVTVHESEVAYTEAGHGDTVVLMHCSSASNKEWRALRAILAARFRCIAPDQWSCGQSDQWPGEGPFSLAREAEPVRKIIDRQRAPIHLVGHCFGGGLALRLARETPDKIASLTLIEPAAFHLLQDSGSDDELFQEVSTVVDAVSSRVLDGNYWDGMKLFVDYWNGEGVWDDMPLSTRRRISNRITKVVLDLRALVDEPATLDDYAALDMPTLLIHGGECPEANRRIVELLAGTMPRSRLERIRNAGHMSPYTHPDEVNRVVTQYLQQISGQPHDQG